MTESNRSFILRPTGAAGELGSSSPAGGESQLQARPCCRGVGGQPLSAAGPFSGRFSGVAMGRDGLAAPPARVGGGQVGATRSRAGSQRGWEQAGARRDARLAWCVAELSAAGSTTKPGASSSLGLFPRRTPGYDCGKTPAGSLRPGSSARPRNESPQNSRVAPASRAEAPASTLAFRVSLAATVALGAAILHAGCARAPVVVASSSPRPDRASQDVDAAATRPLPPPTSVRAVDARQSPRAAEREGEDAAAEGCQSAVLWVTEIMARPRAVADRFGEYVELFNPGLLPVDLRGWTLSNGRRQRHTWEALAPLTVPAGGAVVVAGSVDDDENGDLRALASLGDVRLPDRAGLIHLRDPCGRTVVRFRYGAGPAWPTMHRGVAIELKRPSGELSDGNAWRASRGWTPAGDRGTPGAVPWGPRRRAHSLARAERSARGSGDRHSDASAQTEVRRTGSHPSRRRRSLARDQPRAKGRRVARGRRDWR